MNTKYIFISGGVASSLGKGIIASSLAKLLQARGLRVTIQKFDPYINIDPGTLNPYEHGECYVTEDGAETDLDLGHYERFLGVYTSQAAIKKGIRAENVFVCLDTRDAQGMADMILEALAPGDILLVKASRAVAAERVIECMKKRKNKKRTRRQNG